MLPLQPRIWQFPAITQLQTNSHLLRANSIKEHAYSKLLSAPIDKGPCQISLTFTICSPDRKGSCKFPPIQPQFTPQSRSQVVARPCRGTPCVHNPWPKPGGPGGDVVSARSTCQLPYKAVSWLSPCKALDQPQWHLVWQCASAFTGDILAAVSSAYLITRWSLIAKLAFDCERVAGLNPYQ